MEVEQLEDMVLSLAPVQHCGIAPTLSTAGTAGDGVPAGRPVAMVASPSPGTSTDVLIASRNAGAVKWAMIPSGTSSLTAYSNIKIQ